MILSSGATPLRRWRIAPYSGNPAEANQAKNEYRVAIKLLPLQWAECGAGARARR